MWLYRRIDLFEQPWQQSIQRCIAAGCMGMKGVRLEGFKGVEGGSDVAAVEGMQ